MIFTINLPIRKFNLPLGNQLPRFPLSRYLVIKIHVHCAVYKFRSTSTRCTAIPSVSSLRRRSIHCPFERRHWYSSKTINAKSLPSNPSLHNGVLLQGCETNASCRVDSMGDENSIIDTRALWLSHAVTRINYGRLGCDRSLFEFRLNGDRMDRAMLISRRYRFLNFEIWNFTDIRWMFAFL